MSLKIYHNPRCSKSRQTLQLIEQKGIYPEIVEYLKTPPTAQELKEITQLLNISPRELLRTKEAEYTAQGLDNMALDDETIIDIMVNHPKLIERPLVVDGKRAIIGRPPENVLELI
ncbi:MAG: arsenate reductase (glutaredoxin) [Gammaproteobacteria bacterium]|nr:arsenate reductase (glutaredoxin) [Gammaproteobacteria bacterium]